MKKITIGFSKSNLKFPIGSWAIQLYQWTPFSHCYVRIETKALGSDTILHASEGIVHRMSEEQFNKKHQVIEEFNLFVEESEYYKALRVLHYYSGANYGLLQNLGIVLVDIASLFNIKLKNPFQKGWNCSEYCTVLLQQIEPKLVKNIDPQTVTPKQLYKLLKSHK